jgi:uncharacterized protein YcbK (DUF882 family)
LASKSVADSLLCPPPELQGEPQKDFARRVDALVALFPEIFPTSYYRTPEHNAVVGGQGDSLHTEGLAIDLDLLGADETRLTDVGANAVALGLSAIVYWGSGKSYVHVQARPLRSGSRLVTQRT